MLRFCVLGAGHGGMAMAGHLGAMGFPVTLWARRAESLAAVAAEGGVQVEGEFNGFGPVVATADIADALEGADTVLVVVPASAHGEIAARCAPFLKSGQKVLLLPGRTGGAIEFARTLHRAGNFEDVLVGEAQTFLYASRRVGPFASHIYGIKKQVAAAALPAHRTGELLAGIKPAFPQFMPARWVWKTSLDNIGAIFHPLVVILNAGRIESTGGAFRHYRDGITPSVAGLLEQVDAERVAVARAIGVGALTAREWLQEAYGVDPDLSLYDGIQATRAYDEVGSPCTLDHRYLWEDVPTGLVPMSELGRVYRVPTPTIDAAITMASAILQYDFRRHGRTLERLGLEGWSPARISRFAMLGELVDEGEMMDVV
ncbi:MAG TPA: NAD/NADP octopine/nopaline dehydrogenase family protein [Symbiobacteriaceae bacterium]|nr:NAD/NADP octopine/nopaline dehydrogenase family protein [Symbiobacteriaceae bacterium]